MLPEMPLASPFLRDSAGGDPRRGEDGSGWGRAGSGGPAPERAPREPALRAPWPALLLALLPPVGYALQHLGGDPLATADRLGFRPALLMQGGWTGLLSALVVHAGWTHALLNGLTALAFGAPVARRMGTGALGAAAFLLFFVVCGVAGSLGFAGISPGSGAVLVGASGGIAGLMGASSRLLAGEPGSLLPLTARPVVVMALAWLGANLVFALVGLDVGTGGAPIAWQAHLAGYAAGLLLIGPALALLGPPSRPGG